MNVMDQQKLKAVKMLKRFAYEDAKDSKHVMRTVFVNEQPANKKVAIFQSAKHPHLRFGQTLPL